MILACPKTLYSYYFLYMKPKHNIIKNSTNNIGIYIYMGYFMGSEQLKILISLKIFLHSVFYGKNMLLKF